MARVFRETARDDPVAGIAVPEYVRDVLAILELVELSITITSSCN
jgi:hypothetical protein